MEGVKLFSRITLFYMICSVVVSANARPASVSNSAAAKCKIDEDCDVGKFCYQLRECVGCRNCAKMGRSEPRDNNCARTKDECGPCLSGYKDKGNFCIATTTTTEGTLRVKSSYNANAKTNNSESPPSLLVSSTVWIWICGCGVLVFIFILSCLVFHGVKRWKRDSPSGRDIPKRGFMPDTRIRRNSEKIGLTSTSVDCDGMSSDEFGASAPVEEEYHQPPYNYNLPVDNDLLRPSCSRKHVAIIEKGKYRSMTESDKQKALPFDMGNGSGDWAVYPVAPFGNHPNHFGNQNHDVNNQPPFPEQANDLEMDEHVHDGAIVLPAEEEAVAIQEGAIPGQNENNPENANEDIPHHHHEGVFFQLNLNIRAFFRRFQQNPEHNVSVGEAPEWMHTTQVNVMNPRTTSNASLDSGISSSAGETREVPSSEIAFAQIVNSPDNDVVMEAEEDS